MNEEYKSEFQFLSSSEERLPVISKQCGMVLHRKESDEKIWSTFFKGTPLIQTKVCKQTE